MSQLISRAASVLRALQDHPEGRSVGEVAEAVGLPRSTVHRLLQSLADEHLVAVASQDSGFRLGPALMHLARSADRGLIEQVHPHLEVLSRELGETVDLAVHSGTEVYFVDQVAAPHRLQAVSQTGLGFPVHCTANGKAMLATLTDDQVTALLGRQLEPMTPNTITDLGRLLGELGLIRRVGVAVDREEHHLGISAVGTMLDNPHGLVVALSVPVPTSRFVEREQELTEGLLAARARIESHLVRGTQIAATG